MNINKSERPLVVVVGGGFAGIEFIKTLDENIFDILLIDKVNHYQFQPLFYQVATSQIEPSSISFPLRHVFKNKKNIQFRLGELLNVDQENNKIETNIGEFSYDYLIIGMGCKTNFFGNKEISKHALSLKTTYEAINIRNHILLNFEAVLSANEKQKESLLNIVIVGGGPTGVELAGAFSEIKKHILPHDYKRIDFSKLRIILVEGSPNTLNSMSETAKSASREYLKEMGVELMFEKFVKGYDGEVLMLSDGNSIKTKTVIWAAGVIANQVPGIPEVSVSFDNRLIVDRYNRVSNCDNIYALGDIAKMETPKYPKGHPQLANVAINQAKNLAKNLKREKQGKSITEYEYKDLGSMATVGRNKAIVDLPFANIKGLFGWLIWMFLHLMLILSVKNKLVIFIDWAWAYITKDTALRLILRDTNKAK